MQAIDATEARPIESKKEEESRLRREEETHDHSLRERRLVFRAGLGFLGAVTLLAIGGLLFSPDADYRGWATTTLTSLVTGFLAYLVGKYQPK
jgi:uncharacterized membrane-anchored protein